MIESIDPSSPPPPLFVETRTGYPVMVSTRSNSWTIHELADESFCGFNAMHASILTMIYCPGISFLLSAKPMKRAYCCDHGWTGGHVHLGDFVSILLVLKSYYGRGVCWRWGKSYRDAAQRVSSDDGSTADCVLPYG